MARETELNNVVESLVERVRRTGWIVARRRWLALLVAMAIAVTGFAGVSLVSERYRASARIYVDTQTVLRPLMASITFQPDIDQQVGMLARTLISRPNVERLVQTPGLGLAWPDSAARDKGIARLMNEIKITAAGSGNLFDVSYLGSSPEQAQRLVEATVALFVDAGAGAKKRDSHDAGKFIEEQIRTYEAKLVESENRLKEFKMRNFGVSGVSNQDYFTRVSVLSEEVSKLRVELNAAERSRDAYSRELAAEEPQLPADLLLRGEGLLGKPETRLEAQRKILDDLLRRYTEAHPDVVNARRVVAQLEAEERDLKLAEQRAGTKGGKSLRAATSPVYQKLRITLAETEAQVASLRSQLAAKQVLLDEVRAAAGRLPQVEAELAQLNRDYDIIRKNYDLMVARRESAALGERLDESSQLAEFRVVDPPRVSSSPAFPSRLHIAVLTVLLSLAGGVAAAVAVDRMRPTFDQKRALLEFTGRPVLGTLSMRITPAIARERRRSALRFATAFGLLMVAQIAWVSWIAVASNPRWLLP